jgi:hypothetical protein
MILHALLFATALAAQDGPRVSARLSTTNVAVGDVVVLEISVQQASGSVQIGSAQLPAGLVLMGTQDFTQTQITLPGGRTQTRRRDYTLQAAAPGRYRIGPVQITIDNRAYRTNVVELVVTGTARPRSVESGDDVWLKATMQPETVYVGQQSTLTVEAGFSEDVRVRLTRPPVFDTPSPTGFWVQDVPGGVRAQQRIVNGRWAEIQSMQKAYFPLTAGRYAFAPARAIIDVREGFLFAPETREVRSASPKLTVLPLPEQGKPSDFKGAVGQYQVRAMLGQDTVAVGEAAQLTIELSGIGNMKAAPPPVLPAIPGVEQFAPTEEATVEFDGATVRGTKRFQWVIIPGSAGTISIPSASYSFFDPVARSYQTTRTAPLTLHVVASTASGAGDDDAGTTLHALRTRPEHASLQWIRTRWFLFAQALPLLAVLLTLLVRRVRSTRSETTSLLADLKRVKESNAPYPQFLRDLEAVLRAALQRGGGTESVRARVHALIQRIEAERFAPSSTESVERDALVREAELLLRAMQRGASDGKAHASVLVFALALLQSPAPGAFQQGADLYRAGRFTESARAFERVVAADSLDIGAWVNLGNAHYRAGERGRAIWAWARAAREQPRDRDIVRNLQAAGAIEVLRTRPPLSVRPVEWYLLAAICWWLAGVLAVIAVLRRRNVLLSWALAPVALVVIALIVGVLANGRSYVVAWNEQTQLYGDPTVHSPVIRRVQAGAGLDILEDRGDWLRVRTFSGAEGWVESDTVGRI